MFSGRLGRTGFIMANLYFLGFFLALIVLYAILMNQAGTSVPPDSDLFGEPTPAQTIGNTVIFLLSSLAILVGIPALIGAQVRRFHDMGQTGWLWLLSFVPVVGLVALVAQLFVPSSPDNAYGPIPPRTFDPLHAYGLKK